jgi:putative two-component system response regulator
VTQNIQTPLLLIVDDKPDNIQLLVDILRSDYEIKVAINGERALTIAATHPKPDLIILDVMMPQMDGYATCRHLKENPATAAIPVIFITAKNSLVDEQRGFNLGAVDYINKPISPPKVLARVKTHLALYRQNLELAQKINAQTEEIKQTRLEIIQHLARAAEHKDNDTGQHVIRIGHYARLIAEAYGGHPDWVELVLNAAPMHDIGKVGIPDQVLLKPGKLNNEEWRLMQQHCQIGADIFGEDPPTLLKVSKQIALSHHERWNGSGYPAGLVADAIPLEARIVAIADVFDALTSERPYKSAWSIEKSIEHIDAASGSHFDPAIVDLFHQVLPDILLVRQHHTDD